MLKLNPKSFRFQIAGSLIVICVAFVLFAITGYLLIRNSNLQDSHSLSDKKLVENLHTLAIDVSHSNALLKDMIISDETALHAQKSTLSDSIHNKLRFIRSLRIIDDTLLIKRIASNVSGIQLAQNNFEQHLTNLRERAVDSSLMDETLESEEQLEDQEIIEVEDIESLGFDLNQVHDLSMLYNSSIQPLVNELTGNVAQAISHITKEKEPEQSSSIDLFKLLVSGGIIILLGIFIISFLTIDSTIQKSIERARTPLQILSKGNLPEIEEVPSNEMGVVVEEINELTRNLEKIKDFAVEVGSGHYDSEANIFDNKGDIGKSLQEMRDSLSKIAADEKERNWLNEGFAKFSDTLRQNSDNLSILSKNVINGLVRYVNANQGGIFILNDEDKSNQFLELTACYAYERNKYHQKQLFPGEGLVGQCFLEKQSIFLTDVPNNYVSITSGLGGANPTNLFIVPLKINEAVLGIIELASFNKFKNVEMEFIQKAAESIAASISSVKINARTKKLLEDSQMAAEQLKSQEEEMRQNMEELIATQEEMHRNQAAVIENEQKTHLIFLNAFDAIVTTDEDGVIDLFNPAAEKIFGYSAEEIHGRNLNLLVAKKSNTESIEIAEHNDILNLIGTSREIEAIRKNGQTFTMRVKVEKGVVGNRNVFLAFIEDLSIEAAHIENTSEELHALQQSNDDLLLKIEKNKQWSETLFENSGICCISINKNGKVIRTNSTFEAMFKYESGDLTTLSELLPELDSLGGSEFIIDYAFMDHRPPLNLQSVNKEGELIDILLKVMQDYEGQNYLLIINPIIESVVDKVSEAPDRQFLVLEEITKQKLSDNKNKMKKIVEEERYLMKKKKKS